MGKVIVMNWVTLDGVTQSPGRPQQDTRDGFVYGGWGIPYGDEATVAKVGERMGEDHAWLRDGPARWRQRSRSRSCIVLGTDCC
jgi:hypothetical protein